MKKYKYDGKHLIKRKIIVDSINSTLDNFNHKNKIVPNDEISDDQYQFANELVKLRNRIQKSKNKHLYFTNTDSQDVIYCLMAQTYFMKKTHLYFKKHHYIETIFIGLPTLFDHFINSAKDVGKSKDSAFKLIVFYTKFFHLLNKNNL